MTEGNVWFLSGAECARIGVSPERAAAIGARLASAGVMPGATPVATWVAAVSAFFDAYAAWPSRVEQVALGSLRWLELSNDDHAGRAVEVERGATIALAGVELFRRVVENAAFEGLPPPTTLADAFVRLTGASLAEPAPHADRGRAVFGCTLAGRALRIGVAATTGVVDVAARPE